MDKFLTSKAYAWSPSQSIKHWIQKCKSSNVQSLRTKKRRQTDGSECLNSTLNWNISIFSVTFNYNIFSGKIKKKSCFFLFRPVHNPGEPEPSRVEFALSGAFKYSGKINNARFSIVLEKFTGGEREFEELVKYADETKRNQLISIHIPPNSAFFCRPAEHFLVIDAKYPDFRKHISIPIGTAQTLNQVAWL